MRINTSFWGEFMGIIGFLGKLKQQQADDKRISFELQKKIDKFYNLSVACNNYVKPINNIYWCIELNLDFSLSSPNETKASMENYLDSIDKLNVAYQSAKFYYSDRPKLKSEYSESMKKLDEDYKKFFIFVSQVISRIESLRTNFPHCKQLLTLLDALKSSLNKSLISIPENYDEIENHQSII